MRTVMIALLFVAAALAAWLTFGQPPRIAPDPPPPVETGEDAYAVPESRVLIRAEIALPALEAALNAAMPVNFDGVADNPVPDPLKNDTARWTVTRGVIAVADAGGRLAVSAPLTGIVQVAGTVKLLVKVKLKAEGQVAGNATAVMLPAVGPDWRVKPNLDLHVDISQAEVPLEGIGTVSLKGLLGRDLEKLAEGLAPKLEAELAKNPFLEKAASGLWVRLCDGEELRVEGETGWLSVVPHAFTASRMAIADGKVSLALGLRAAAQVLPERSAEPMCPPLAPLEVVDDTPAGDVKLAMPIALAWDAASRLASEEIAKKPMLGKADGFANVRARGVTFAPYGKQVLVRLDFLAETRVFFFPLTFSGHVYATADPVFDPIKARLRFGDVKLTNASGAALGARSALAAYLIELAGTPEIDFTKPLEKARAKAEKALKKLAARLGAVDDQGLAVTSIVVTGVAVTKNAVIADAVASGTAGISVLSLDFGQ